MLCVAQRQICPQIALLLLRGSSLAGEWQNYSKALENGVKEAEKGDGWGLLGRGEREQKVEMW